MTTPSTYFSANQDGGARGGRMSDSLHVQLLWRQHDDDVTILVDDPAVGVTFAGLVNRERAIDAFYYLFE